MAAPSTGVLLTLDVPNEFPASLGGAVAGPFQVSVANLSVFGERFESWSGPVSQSYYTTPFAADQECHAVMANMPTFDRGLVVACRIHNPADPTTAEAYLGAYHTGVGFRIFKMLTGGSSFPQVGATDATAASVGEMLWLKCAGTTIKLYHYTGGAWVERVSATDSSITGSGYIGWQVDDGVGALDNPGGGAIVTGQVDIEGVNGTVLDGIVGGVIQNLSPAVVVRSVDRKVFGGWSGKIALTGSKIEGEKVSTQTGRAYAAGSYVSAQARVCGDLAPQVEMLTRIVNTDATVSDFLSQPFLLPAAPTLVEMEALQIEAGKTGDKVEVHVRTTRPQPGAIILDGLQVEPGRICTPFNHTDGATAARSGRLQIPSRFMAALPFWVAIWVEHGWGTANMPEGGAGLRYLLDWRLDSTHYFVIYFDEATLMWNVRRANGSSGGITSAAQTIAKRDKTLVAAVATATELRLSINGAPFSIATVGNVSDLSGVALADICTQAGTKHFQGWQRWLTANSGEEISSAGIYDIYHQLAGGVEPRLANLPGWWL